MAGPPRPKSPPGCSDLYGRRRQVARVQVLEREIGFLQDELKSLERLQHSSRCCQELNEFVSSKPDSLVPTCQNSEKSHCSWSRTRGVSCFRSWICCVSGCSSRTLNCCVFRQSGVGHHDRGYCCRCCLCQQKTCVCDNCCRLRLCCPSLAKLKLCPNCVASCCCC